MNKEQTEKNNNLKIEETTKCDTDRRARDTRDYESMLMDYLFEEFKVD